MLPKGVHKDRCPIVMFDWRDSHNGCNREAIGLGFTPAEHFSGLYFLGAREQVD